MNTYTLISLVLMLTYLFGKVIKPFKIPTIFIALFLGLIASQIPSLIELVHSDIIISLSDIGLFLLLFIIGLEFNVTNIVQKGSFIYTLSFYFILIPSLIGAILIYYIADLSWIIAFLTATSFITVGEEILLPILDEFSIVNSEFGQTLIGIGTLDDIAELLLLFIATLIISGTTQSLSIYNISAVGILGILFYIPYILHKLQPKFSPEKKSDGLKVLTISIAILFLFIGLSKYSGADAIGAILAGITLNYVFSRSSIKKLKKDIRILSYALFVPIFFFTIGTEVNLRYLIQSPFLILAILLVTSISKILVSYFFARNKFGLRKSILLGVGLSIKFSTGIIIIQMLRESSIITTRLYSILIGSMILTQFIVPILLAVLLKRWKIKFKKINME